MDKRRNLKRNRSAPRLDYPTKELGEKKDFVSCFFPAHFFSSFLPFVNQKEVFFGKPLLFSNAQLISWKAPKGFSHSLSSYYISVPNDYIRELLCIQRLTSSIRAFKKNRGEKLESKTLFFLLFAIYFQKWNSITVEKKRGDQGLMRKGDDI